MPQLLRLRYVSVGHPQARMHDLVLDFRGPDGRAMDSTVWLRNGGGKSSILNLFFAILRPHRGEFLGSNADTQRSLDDYILTGDRAVTLAEWQLDRTAAAPEARIDRFITGVFYERREGSAGLKRLFFSTRVSDEHPHSTLDGLPLFSGNGSRTRSTLPAFREAWLTLRDRAPHLSVGETFHQWEWQEQLEAAGIDPELFSYQVAMNQREGGADELFKFADAEDFVDFLLRLALDPALGDRVARNVSAWRRELIERKDQLIPERELVLGLMEKLLPLRETAQTRQVLRQRLADILADMTALGTLASSRRGDLETEASNTEVDRDRHEKAAAEQSGNAQQLRARAAALRCHAAELRVQRLQKEHAEVQEEFRVAQRMARIWAAAVPLHSALHFEEQARQQRSLLEQRLIEHAPLRAQLGEAARRLASVLDWRVQEERQLSARAREREASARDEARQCREQLTEASKTEAAAQTRAKELKQKLAATEERRQRLIAEQIVGGAESVDDALTRWTETVREDRAAIDRLGTEINRIELRLNHLEPEINAASDVVSERRSTREQHERGYEKALKEKERIESNMLLHAVLQLETIDADRLSTEAVTTLEHAAHTEQRSVVALRCASADEERAALHIEEQGLLPPSLDATRVLDVLRERLGGQAWSGWTWIQANVRAEDAIETIRRAPYLAQGVIVRPGDFERAREILQELGVEPDGPLALAPTTAFDAAPEIPSAVLGPAEKAWFNRAAAAERLAQLRTRLDDHDSRLRCAEERHQQLMTTREMLRSFREHYAVGWFTETAEAIQTAIEQEHLAREHLNQLRQERADRTSERRRLDADQRSYRDALQRADSYRSRVEAFLEDYARPAIGWVTELQEANEAVEAARADIAQWQKMADLAEGRATDASTEASRHGETARGIEIERAQIRYIVGDLQVGPGALDELRARYQLLCAQYEEKVGAEALSALADQNEANAARERVTLASLLSEDITESLVRQHLSKLAEPDRVDELRGEAERNHGTLLGRLGNLAGRVESARQSLSDAEKVCRDLGVIVSLERAPSTPELAEVDAKQTESDAQHADTQADAARQIARECEVHAQNARSRAAALRNQLERLQHLAEDYEDLLEAMGLPPSSPPPDTIEETALAERVQTIADQLKQARSDTQNLNSKRRLAAAALHTFAAQQAFEGVSTHWSRRLRDYDEPALEEASAHLSDQLEIRQRVLEAQIADVDRHRTILVDELQAVADDGLKLLRHASTQSRLPEGLPGIGGAQFLRITTQEPEDPGERRARLAELVDELVSGQHKLDGISLVQAAVRKLARPMQVRVLHPDPALDRQSVTIPEMALSSGGEQLTGAILLYCTLARVRGRSRGHSRHATSVLLLDNPIGRASRVRFLELQRDVARAMGVQLIYTTGVHDYEALRALPNIIRLRNERVDRNSGRRLVEHSPDETRSIEAVRIARREPADEQASAQ